jgi:gas vesicle protein
MNLQHSLYTPENAIGCRIRVGSPAVYEWLKPRPAWSGDCLSRKQVIYMRMGSYESSENTNLGTAVTFFLIGLGAGTLAGLLLAPKTGKQLRRDLKRGYEDARDAVGDWADDAKDRVRDASDRVRDAAQRGADLAEDLRDAARDKVEPLRRAINRG